MGAVENMYFLWSVERVAMLYDLHTIDGKDWYGYGAQKLLKHQGGAGDWPSWQYPGNCAQANTCFALLFLKRSNLVSDLTLHLRLATTVRDPEKWDSDSKRLADAIEEASFASNASPIAVANHFPPNNPP